MRVPARLRLLVATLVLLALAPIPAAMAHAQLLSTEPAENAVLDIAPKAFVLTFNEPVSPLALKLIGPDGGATDVEATGGTTVTVRAPTGLARGTHVLSYRVVSTDGHPIGGSLLFSIGEATGAHSAPAADATVSVALWAGKVLLFIAMFVGVGGAVFMVVGAFPPSARALAIGLSVLGGATAIATLGLQGVDALGLPLSAIVDGAAWNAAFSTSYGVTAIVAGIAFLASFGALRMPFCREAKGLGMLAGVLAALSLALSGHASAATPQWLTRPAVFLHIGSLLFWIGALVPLWVLLRDRSEPANEALARFSAAIPFAVVPLLVSGAALAIIQLGWPGEHWLTPYGFILAAKLGLLVILFGLAVWNRLYLTAPALAGDERQRRHLRQSIGLETAIILIVLALVAGWRFTPPPRALALAPTTVADAPVYAHAMDAQTMAMISISPGKAGPVIIDIEITAEDGTPRAAQSVAMTLSSPALGIEPIKRPAVQTEAGWRIPDLTIPLAGTWQLEIDVRASRFELFRLQTELVIP